MPAMAPNDTATSSSDHHAALMHGHDHEGLSERTRHHTHGDNTEDLDEKKSKNIGKMMTPYLAQHIPHQYNPQGTDRDGHDAPRSTADTKYCYRHRPDLLCRRQADEPSMKELQDVRSPAFPYVTATYGRRNSSRNPRSTSRASPTCGRSSRPRPLDIAT
jgi:hypothetical protein